MFTESREQNQYDLLQTNKSSSIMIEYTTGCNMRCTYCSVSKESWVAEDLNEELANRISKEAITRKPDEIIIHGHGETTMLEGWEDKAQQFIDAKMNVSICTNLAKEYTLKELYVLAQLHNITISLDTIDIKLFKKLRSGGDIRHVIYNMTRIQDFAKRIGNNSLKNRPSISWSIVCCDKTIGGLLDLIEYGISLGVDAFTICNLRASEAPEGKIPTKHVSEMNIDLCSAALAIMEQITERCKEKRKKLDIKPGIMDTLKLKVKDGVTNWTRPV